MTTVPPPTLAGTLGVAGPVFLRKVNRQHWGLDGDDEGVRLETAVQRIFLDDRHHPEYSFYLAATDDDLRRVALALNATRQKRDETIDFVAFLPEEAEAAGVSFTATLGETPCVHANGLHRDTSPSADALRELCRLAMKQGRAAGRCSKGDMKTVIELARGEQCQAASEVAGACTVTSCVVVPG